MSAVKPLNLGFCFCLFNIARREHVDPIAQIRLDATGGSGCSWNPVWIFAWQRSGWCSTRRVSDDDALGLFQGQGTTEQACTVGINSLQTGPGSPVMNRIEAGETGGDRNQGVPGATGQANPGAAMHGNTQQVTGTTPAQGSVGGAGTSVGHDAGASASAPSVLPPPQSVFGMYGPVRGGLMDACSESELLRMSRSCMWGLPRLSGYDRSRHARTRSRTRSAWTRSRTRSASMQCSARFRSWRHVHGKRNRRCDASALETPGSVKAHGRAGTDAVIARETDTW